MTNIRYGLYELVFATFFLTGKFPFSEHNKLFHANKTTFRLGMNVHGDMTATEFAARF